MSHCSVPVSGGHADAVAEANGIRVSRHFGQNSSLLNARQHET